MTAPLKLMIGIPAYRGQVHYGHVMQMMSMAATCIASKAFAIRGFLAPESCSIDWSRNQMLHMAVKDGSDWLLMCDADTFHQRAPDIVTMILDAQGSGDAVVAAPVRLRGKPGHNVYRVVGGVGEQVESDYWQGRQAPVDRIGTAMMAVNCNWIRQCWPEQPWFVTQQLAGKAPSKIGEDISFCDGVRERGGRIMVDGRFEPVHVGA